MKVFGIVMKVLLALAAIGGAIWVIVNYGDKIVAWFKKTFPCCCECCCEDGECCCDDGECCCEDGECCCQCECEEAAEETAAVEAPAEEGDFEN